MYLFLETFHTDTCVKEEIKVEEVFLNQADIEGLGDYFPVFFILCMCFYAYEDLSAMTHVQESKDSLWEFILSFHYVRGWDQVVRLGSKHLLSLNHLASPTKIFEKHVISSHLLS